MLLIGPPGSGKTGRVLAALAGAVRSGRADEVQLLVPTASMRNHVLFALAREGLMVPTRLVSTLSEFVQGLTPELKQVSPAVRDRLLRRTVRRQGEDGFGALARAPGLPLRLGRLMDEIWAAGASSLHLQGTERSRSQRTFLRLFREFEEALDEMGLVHSNQRIAAAATVIRRDGLGDVRTVYLDGFDRFTRPQEGLLAALQEQCEDIVVTLPDGLDRYPLPEARVEDMPPRPGDGPAVETVEAASPRNEVLEIARRILGSGRPFQEHAIIVRSEDVYLPLLRETFDALEIPYRAWAGGSLAEHGVVRHFLLWLRAIHGQFSAGEVLEAIVSPLTPGMTSDERDAFDFKVRERLPGAGLEFLREVATQIEGPRTLLDGLNAQRDWHGKRFGASRWRRECLALLPRILALEPPAEGTSFRRLRDFRLAQWSLKRLRNALAEVAALPDLTDRRLSLAEFIEALEDVLGSVAERAPDDRFGVVHVLPVQESRQWSVPVTFVCGLAEGWFPRRHSEDALFDDEDRRLIVERGFDLRTSAAKASDERIIYRLATTRATVRLVRSYPAADGQGRPLLPSSCLEDDSPVSRPDWLRIDDPRPGVAARSEASLPSALLKGFASSNATFSTSGLDDYLQCPHLFFGRHTLKLKDRVLPPERRMDARLIGEVVHEVLAQWNRGAPSMGELLDSVFRHGLRRAGLQEGLRTERLRLELRSNLERFAAETAQASDQDTPKRAFFEEKCTYSLPVEDGRATVRGRIDRFDLDDRGRCFVTDYKYSGEQRVKALLKNHLDGHRLQLLLYLAALEQQVESTPGGVVLCGLRDSTTRAGFSTDGVGDVKAVGDHEVREHVDRARDTAAKVVAEVLDGNIRVEPRDTRLCEKYCDFRAVCRVRWLADGGAGLRGTSA